MDSGIENINASVNELVESGIIKRVLAQVEVTYSNSMIESWWRSIKHQWLFLHSLDTIETVRKLVAFYVTGHNTQVPHYAFKGQTPDEMYFSTESAKIVVQPKWKPSGALKNASLTSSRT